MLKVFFCPALPTATSRKTAESVLMSTTAAVVLRFSLTVQNLRRSTFLSFIIITYTAVAQGSRIVIHLFLLLSSNKARWRVLNMHQKRFNSVSRL